jgi:hypothetical protein
MKPQSPNKDFDFMLKDNPPAKRGLPIPNLPKPAKIGLAVIGAVFLLIIISSVLSNRNKGSTQPFVGALAQANEMLRVTTLVQQQLPLQDPQTQTLAATLSSALNSDKHQITSYLVKNRVKVSTAQLTADTDKSTDASLQTASQNNNLDSAYVNYLKGALAKYETDLQTAYKGAGPNGQKLLSGSFESARTLLNTAPIKS